MGLATDPADPLEELRWRSEILQAMYWMRGEGLGDDVEVSALANFLAVDAPSVALQMRELHASGYLERTTAGYRLSQLGTQEGGRSFQDEFADYIRPAHGECGAGCWCKDPKHAGEPCPGTPASPAKPESPRPERPRDR